MERQVDASLFERLALSKNKKGVMALSKKGNHIVDIHQAIKDPYILDFLKIPQSHKVTEKLLEQKIIDNLQSFLLELGKASHLLQGNLKSLYAISTFMLIWFSITGYFDALY